MALERSDQSWLNRSMSAREALFCAQGVGRIWREKICFSVHRHGSCDVKNHTLNGQLKCETEEQVIAWKQSFSTREELAYEPYEGLADQEGVEVGVIFTRIPLTGS